ncbi:ATP-binding protein [Magnetococcus sp. PR-3]|uniref:ATP-binding protein n=1 Tax=Magnetococcus sp. PR-3 TaxID=3120355 RepID=UPI002FCDF13E
MAEPHPERSTFKSALQSGGIGHRLAVLILLFSSLVTLILTSFQLYLDFRHDVDTIHTRLNEVQQSHVKSMAASLWNLDTALLKLQMEGLAQLPDIVGVELRDTHDNHTDPLHLTIGDTQISNRTITRDYHLISKEVDESTPLKIGQLRLYASLEAVYARLQDKALVILASQGIKTFLVSLFILLIIHRLVTRHLIAISHYASDLDLTTLQPPLELQRRKRPRDEFELVTDSINQMRDGLQHAYGALQQHSILLQQRVEERNRAQQAQEVLSRLLSTALKPWDLNTQLEKALDIILEVHWLNLKPYGSLFLMSEDGNKLVLTTNHRTPPALVEQCSQVDLGSCLCGQAALQRTPIFATHVDDRHHTHYEGMADHGHCCVPILHQGEILGVLNLYLEAEHQLTQEDRTLVLAMADALASLIHAKQSEMALLDSKEAAEAGNRTKDRFLAIMSHELRTPMNAILGFGEILENTTLSPTQEDLLAKQRRASEDLLDLITDILEMSQFDAHLPDPIASFFPLDTFCNTLQEEWAPRAKHKGLTLTLHQTAPTTPLYGCQPLLKKVLMILLGNAIKFTDQGDVTLRTALEGETLVLEVQDTGVGIPEDIMDQIFQPFTQGDDSFTRRYGGAGIGLAVAHRYTSAMKGTIRAIQPPQGGTLFQVHIPTKLENVSQHSGTPSDVEPQPPLTDQGIRILYAEDDEMNATLVSTLLGKTPHDLTVVDNGALALERIQSERFDLVLMDIQMPVMDGYQATRAIRAWEHQEKRPRMPIYALTAHALQQDIEQSRQAGCDKHLTKPIARTSFLAMIESIPLYPQQT